MNKKLSESIRRRFPGLTEATAHHAYTTIFRPMIARLIKEREANHEHIAQQQNS